MKDQRFMAMSATALQRTFLQILVPAGLIGLAIFPGNAEARDFAFSNSAKPFTEGEVELETWVTWKTGKDSDRDFNRFDFRHELELGLSERSLLGLYLADWRHQIDSKGESSTFRSVGVEYVYNFTDPKIHPFGFSLYNEILGGEDLLVFENKLLFQKNIGDWKLVFNNVIEAEWEDPGLSKSKGEFKQTLGAHYKLSDWLYAGAEAWHEAEYEDWKTMNDSLVYLGPSVKVKSRSEIDWSFVLATGVQLTNENSEPNYATRMIFGYEF